MNTSLKQRNLLALAAFLTMAVRTPVLAWTSQLLIDKFNAALNEAAAGPARRSWLIFSFPPDSPTLCSRLNERFIS
jgi:hypothetical protein